MNIQTQIQEELNKLTEEFLNASVKKAEEIGFDQNRGEISLSETYFNLIEIKNSLNESINKNRLTQLPISIQKNFLTWLIAITEKIGRLINGTDEIVNIVDAVESLYVHYYYSRLETFTDEHLGYTTRLNQLKHLITEASKLRNEINNGLEMKVRLESLLLESHSNSSEMKAQLESAVSNTEFIKSEKAKATELIQELNTIAVTISSNEKIVADLLAEVRINSNSIKTVQKESDQFSNEIAGIRENVQNLEKQARETLDEHKNNTNEIVEELQSLELQIKDQIQKATGFSLFHSFQTRQTEIGKNKWIWLLTITILLLGVMGLTVWISVQHKTYDTAFYLKTSLSLPLIFGISFCAVQYSRERKLEEEYAFKSNISISLIPYKDLIENVSTTPEEKERYTTFMIESISRVFTSPTEAVFGKGSEIDRRSKDAIRNLSNAMESIVKPIEPILKVLNKNNS